MKAAMEITCCVMNCANSEKRWISFIQFSETNIIHSLMEGRYEMAWVQNQFEDERNL